MFVIGIMARKTFVNGFVWIAALTQVQYAVQDIPSSTESPMKYHHERGAPVHPRVVNHSYTYMFISWSPPNDTVADINNYIVNYFKSINLRRVEMHDQKMIPANETKTFLKGLQAGTRYSFFVIANYSTGHMPVSSTVSIQLLGYGETNLCLCNYTGTDKTKLDECNIKTGQCECINEYTKGRACNECTKSAFWHSKLGCERCPCSPDKTRDGTCYFHAEVVMCHCLNLHAGRDCSGCHNGYHLVGTECVRCECSGNQNITNGEKMCDDKTGKCLSCGYNTAGEKCDICKPGFVGNALARNCTSDLLGPIGQSAAELNHNLTIGLSLCVASILIITTIVITYLKCRRQKKPFAFWTVTLHNDHEAVNFSSMMEQDFPYSSDTPNGVNSSRAPSQVNHKGGKNIDGNIYRAVKT